jgi:hypothetical protein
MYLPVSSAQLAPLLAAFLEVEEEASLAGDARPKPIELAFGVGDALTSRVLLPVEGLVFTVRNVYDHRVHAETGRIVPGPRVRERRFRFDFESHVLRERRDRGWAEVVQVPCASDVLAFIAALDHPVGVA